MMEDKLMMQQLTVREIQWIMDSLKKPCPNDLMARLVQLKVETEFYVALHNANLIEKMDEQRQRKQNGGYGTSPVSTAYLKLSEPIEDSRIYKFSQELSRSI